MSLGSLESATSGESTFMPMLSGELWRRPEFLKVWLAQAVSEFGSRFARDGLPLTAILVLKATPQAVGLLAAAATAPRVIVGLFAGEVVDHARRRPIMIVCDLVRAGVLATIPLAAVLHLLRFPQLCLAALLAGAASVVFDIANQAYVPDLVDAEHLAEGNTKLGASAAVADVGGPALTGVVVQLLGAPLAVGATALSYLFSAACLSRVKDDESSLSEKERGASRWGRANGLKEIFGNAVVRAICLVDASSTLFVSMFAALYPFIALRELHLSPAMFGVTFAMGGAGALAGAAARPLVMKRLGVGPATLVAGTLAGLASFAIPLTRAPPLAAMLLLAAFQFVGDAFATLSRICATTVRQTAFPQQQLGRVNAGFQVTGGAAAMAGGLIGGLLGQALGPRTAMLIAAAGATLSTLGALGSPLWSLREVPDPPQKSNPAAAAAEDS